MGARKRKRDAFFAAHPTCYLCGEGPPTTIDHMPPRTIFKHRVGPEGYEFSACEDCNRDARLTEQVVALYMKLADHDDDNHDSSDLDRLVSGVRNNSPELLPDINISANQKRQILRERGEAIERGELIADAPIVLYPAPVNEHFEIFGRKLTCALYYKLIGRPLPAGHFITTAKFTYTDKGRDEAIERFRNLLPATVITGRSNTNIRDQFAYIWGQKDEGDVFAFLAQFGRSYFIFGGSTSGREERVREHWKVHAPKSRNSPGAHEPRSPEELAPERLSTSPPQAS
jgi:hypothetical protein